MPTTDTLDGDSGEGMALEAIVDKFGMLRVLEALGDICEAKAEHIAASYSDKPLAQRWHARGKALYHTSGLAPFKD
jgi:hypothetical protein